MQALAERLLSNAVLPIAAAQRASAEAPASDGDGSVLRWHTDDAATSQHDRVEDALLAVLGFIAGQSPSWLHSAGNLPLSSSTGQAINSSAFQSH